MPIVNGLRRGKTATAGLWANSFSRNRLLARLRSWAGSWGTRDTAISSASMAQLLSTWRDHSAGMIADGKVVQFPGSQQTYLRRLGADIRARFVSLGLADFAPFIIEVDSVTPSRLWIDPVAYVESHNAQSGFRIVIDDAGLGPVAFETYDFALVHALVCHYIFARLTESLGGGDRK